MSDVRIKCCGMFRDVDVAAVNAVRPDYCGFIVDFPKSHRSLPPEEAARLAAQVAKGITTVAVVVDQPVEAVAALARNAFGAVQLHGHEDEAYLARLRALTDAPVIQAIQVHGPEDVARANASTANMVLLDAGQGGGTAFDWGLLAGVERPLMLAGGLTPENVAEAIRAVHPWGVDLSSGLETDRLKDPTKIKAAVAAVREA